jgi:hypothetical protein
MAFWLPLIGALLGSLAIFSFSRVIEPLSLAAAVLTTLVIFIAFSKVQIIKNKIANLLIWLLLSAFFGFIVYKILGWLIVLLGSITALIILLVVLFGLGGVLFTLLKEILIKAIRR